MWMRTACTCIVAVASSATLPAGAEVKVGDKVPAVSAQNQSGQTVNLADYLGHKYIVLYFYPKDFTGGCTLQAQRFAEDYAKFASRDAIVVGVSADPVESHEKFCAEYQLPFTLLADTDKSLAQAYGAGDPYGKRSTFLIGKDGRVAHVVSNVSDIKGHNQVLLSKLDELGADRIGPQVGRKAPEVLLPADNGQTWSLASQQGKTIVLTFYRGWVGYQCPHCIKQAKGARSIAEEFNDEGIELVSIYPGPEDKAQEFMKKAGIQETPKNPLLIDENRQAAYAYNVLTADRKGVKPATFVIDPQGIVRWAYIGKDAKDRPDIRGVLLEARKAAGRAQAATTQPAE